MATTDGSRRVSFWEREDRPSDIGALMLIAIEALVTLPVLLILSLLVGSFGYEPSGVVQVVVAAGVVLGLYEWSWRHARGPEIVGKLFAALVWGSITLFVGGGLVLWLIESARG